MSKASKIIAVIVAILLAGCTTEKRCAKKFPPRTDSIYIETIKEHYTDTTIYVDLPPLIIKEYVPIKDTLELKGSYSNAIAWVDSTTLKGELREGIQPVKFEYKIKEIVKIKEVVKHSVERVKYVPKFTRWLAWFGVIAFALIIIRIVLRFIK